MELLNTEIEDKRSDMPRQKKKQISITFDSGLLAWIDEQVKEFTFDNRSSAFEQAIVKLKKELEAKKES